MGFQDGVAVWVPYGWHRILIGVEDHNHLMFVPFALGSMLQEVPDTLRQALVDYLVEAYGAVLEPRHIQKGQDAKRWFSRAV